MSALSFHVPGEPRGKGRPRFVRATGRTYTPAETASYENLVALAAREAMGAQAPLQGPVAISVAAFLQAPRTGPRKRLAAMLSGEAAFAPTKKPDADNLLKICADSLNGIAYRDDAQIVSASITKHWSLTPGLWVTVWPAGAADMAREAAA